MSAESIKTTGEQFAVETYISFDICGYFCVSFVDDFSVTPLGWQTMLTLSSLNLNKKQQKSKHFEFLTMPSDGVGNGHLHLEMLLNVNAKTVIDLCFGEH